MKRRFFIWFVLAVCFFGRAACAESYLRTGDEIVFGSYEQDGNFDNGREPIVWKVVETDRRSGTLTAVSKYLLDCVQYHTSESAAAWKDTHLNQWLQYSFVPSAFTDREKAAMIPTNVSGARQSVFIPSEEEILRYLGGQLLCAPTRYAVSRGVYSVWYRGQLCGSYWLRRDVSVTWGTFAGAHGGIYNQRNNKVTVRDNGVRPAVRLSMDYFSH